MENDELFLRGKTRKSMISDSDDTESVEEQYLDSDSDHSSEDAKQRAEEENILLDDLFSLISHLKKDQNKEEHLKNLLKLIRDENNKLDVINFVSLYLVELLMIVKYRLIIIEIITELLTFRLTNNFFSENLQKLLQFMRKSRILFLLAETLFITRDKRIITLVKLIIQSIDWDATPSSPLIQNKMLNDLVHYQFFAMCAALACKESTELFETIFIRKFECDSHKLKHIMESVVGDCYFDESSIPFEINSDHLKKNVNASNLNEKYGTLSLEATGQMIDEEKKSEWQFFNSQPSLNFMNKTTQSKIDEEMEQDSLSLQASGIQNNMDKENISQEEQDSLSLQASGFQNNMDQENISQEEQYSLSLQASGFQNNMDQENNQEYDSLTLQASGQSQLDQSQNDILHVQTNIKGEFQDSENESQSETMSLEPSGLQYSLYKQEIKYSEKENIESPKNSSSDRNLDFCLDQKTQSLNSISLLDKEIMNIEATTSHQNTQQQSQKKKAVKKRTFPINFPHEVTRPLFPPRLIVKEKILLFPYKRNNHLENKQDDKNKTEEITTSLTESTELTDNLCMSVITCIFLSNYTSFISFYPLISLNNILRTNCFLQSQILSKEINILIRNMGQGIFMWLEQHTEEQNVIKAQKNEKKKKSAYESSPLIPIPLVLQQLPRHILSSPKFLNIIRENYPLNGHSIYLNEPDILNGSVGWVERIMKYLSVDCEHIINKNCKSQKMEEKVCKCFLSCDKFASLSVLTQQTVPFKISNLIVIHKLFKNMLEKHTNNFDNTEDVNTSTIEYPLCTKRVLIWLANWLRECTFYLKKNHFNWARIVFGVEGFNQKAWMEEKNKERILKECFDEKENQLNQEMGFFESEDLFDEKRNKKQKRIIESESDDVDYVIGSDAFRTD